MKKLVLLPVIFLALFPIATAQAGVEGKNPKLVADSLTPEQIKDLNIVVPPETDSGFQVLTIQLYDNKGVQSEQHVYFCKDLAGKIHWDNSCPGLDPLASKEDLSKIKDFNSLPKYSPAQEGKKSAGLIAAAVALFLALASARNKYSETASATFVSLAADKKQAGFPIKRWGDNSITWRFLGYRKTDKWFSDFSSWLSRRSLILARIFGDGDYGRAMFGSLWTLLVLGAPVLGYFSAKDITFNYAAPAMPFLLGLIALGIADAFAGFIASWTFVIAILIKNHPTNMDEILMLIAIALLGYAPVLIAAAARTFRRFTYTSQDRWNKLVDYFLAPMIGLWAVIKLVEGLNGFIGRQFLVSYFAIPLGIFTGFLLLIRMFCEEFANRVYTWRVDSVSTHYFEQKRIWHFMGFVFEVAFGTYLAYKFSEWNYYLAGALALGFTPKLISLIFHKKIPQSKWIQYLTPKGLFLTILLIYAASTFQSYVRGYFDNSREFLLWWIVISSIPAFVFAFIKLFAKSSIHPFQTGAVTKYFWRFGSVVFYFALVAAIFEITPAQLGDILLKPNWHQIFNSLRSGIGL